MENDVNVTEGQPTEAVLTPRATLWGIVEACEHALVNRTAKRYSTRDSMKKLEARCRALLKLDEADRTFGPEFEKVAETANTVFDQLLAEAKVAGHA